MPLLLPVGAVQDGQNFLFLVFSPVLGTVPPYLLCSRKGNHGLLLDECIQLGLRVVDTVPAGTGGMQVCLQDGFSPSSLHTPLHPVVAVVVSVWVSVSPRVYE